MTESSAHLPRRSVLKLASAGFGVAAAAASGLVVVGASPAEAHGTITSYSEIDGTPTWYDDSSPAPASFGYNPSFHSQLETWWRYWIANSAVSWTTPARIYSLGVHNDSRVSEAHNAGRGFDLSRIYAHSGSTLFWPFETYDRWSGRTGSALSLARKRYWATSASLHRLFRNVLTYPYNTDHHSHIHIDNLVYGANDTPTFDMGSEAQVKHVQACLTYIWGYSTAIDGIWGAQTSSNATQALERAGGGGNLRTGTNWILFNTSTFRFGTGRQSY